jgi:hypothetical protein
MEMGRSQDVSLLAPSSEDLSYTAVKIFVVSGFFLLHTARNVHRKWIRALVWG